MNAKIEKQVKEMASKTGLDENIISDIADEILDSSIKTIVIENLNCILENSPTIIDTTIVCDIIDKIEIGEKLP